MKNIQNTRIISRRRERRQGRAQTHNRLLLRIGLIVIVGALLTSVLILGVGTASAVGIYWYVARDLPSPDDIIKQRQQFETTLIYDRSGQTVLYQVIDPLNGDRQWTPISDIPAELVHATVAIEDKSFYENPGFDVRGIARAIFLTLTGNAVQGGSSITQQLVKNTLIDPGERTSISPQRKIKEIILAGEISRRYTKPQILEQYLNTNFYGNLAYGIDAASKVYFGKPVQNLSLGEAALLAAIPQNPQLNPLDAPQPARARQVVVLDKMAELGYITADQAKQAASEPIVVAPLADRYNLIAPHFSLFARQQAEQFLNAQGLDGGRLVARGGLRIFTTLDLDLQYQSECVARSYVQRLAGGDPHTALNTSAGTPCVAAQYIPQTFPQVGVGFQLGKPRNVTNAATVTMNPTTGEVLSMVGSLDYWNPGIDGNYNVALGERQPGSAFKLFTYAAAFAAGKSPATMVWDLPTSFDTGGGEPYKPTNEDGKFHGPMSIREAFASSYNVPAVSVLSQVGIADVIRKAHLLGINTLDGGLDQYGLSLTLGSGEVTLLDMTYAYSVFANMGTMAGTPTLNPRPGYRSLDPVAVLRIEDSDGHILWQFKENTATYGTRYVVGDYLAYLINNVLSDNDARVPAFGRGSAMELSRPAAAKTGTTNENRDAWTLGYTPQLVTGVWVGNNNNTPMGADVIGATGAAPIWHAIMEYAHARDKLPVRTWPRPSTIVEQVVCKDSGLLPTADCPRVRELFYAADANNSTVPRQPDTYYKRITINSRNGLIATASTPTDLRVDKVFFDYPPEARDWARSMGYPLPPTEFDTGGGQVAGATITAPGALSRVRGVVEVKGSVDSPDAVSYSLAYGIGLNPRDWTNIAGGDAKALSKNAPIGKWNTAALDGLYTLRLQVILKDKSVLQDTQQVTVDNKPPTVRLTAPQANATLTASKAITLVANAGDNLDDGLYVEFYQGDKLLGTVRQSPFKLDWAPDTTGTQTVYAIAYDAAGNSTKSAVVNVTVK